MNLEKIINKTFELKETVEYKHTAKSYGSGGIEVYATPAMVALMEGAALNLVQPNLDDGLTTVGIKLEVDHVSATGVGDEVRAVAKLTKTQDRKLCFEIEAYDSKGIIGKCYHERFIINEEKFLNKLK